MSLPDEQLTIDLYKPSEVQQEAHSCRTGNFTEILYGGTAGCGKTWFLRWDPILTQVFGEHERYVEQLRLGNKGWRSIGWAIHFRREYPMLQQTIDRVADFIKKVDPGARWNGDDYIWTFSCGYKLQFANLQQDDSYRKYDSSEYTHIAFDELIQFTRDQYMFLYSRLRTGDPVLGKDLRIVSASNPDAPAEGVWVKERFVDPAPGGRKALSESTKLFDGTVEKRARVFLPASLADNPDEASRREYEITLRQLPHHVMLARLMGDWNVIEGAFFAWEWRPDRHVVKPFPIPKHWVRGRSIDWGYKNACPVYHFAQNPDGDLIFYRETTYNYKLKEEKYRKDAELVALSIRKEEISYGEWDEERNISLVTGPSDPEMEADHGSGGPSIRQTMENHGVYWQKQAKDVEQAVAELLRRLRDVPSDPKKMPGVVFFDTCTEIIRTLPTIPTDKSNPEMPEHGGPHHWLDAVLCACLYCPTSSLGEEKPKPKNHPDFDADEDDLTKARRHKRSLGGFRQFAR